MSTGGDREKPFAARNPYDGGNKPCASSEPHEPHTWTLAAIDGNYYDCPGVPEPPAARGEETMLVYDDGRLLHFPGPNPGTPYTVCGLDAGAMKREERPVMWAGMWCTECMKGATIRV